MPVRRQLQSREMVATQGSGSGSGSGNGGEQETSRAMELWSQPGSAMGSVQAVRKGTC